MIHSQYKIIKFKNKVMTKLEQVQEELIDLLFGQVADLTMMSKIELGDDVIFQIRILQDKIKSLKTA